MANRMLFGDQGRQDHIAITILEEAASHARAMQRRGASPLSIQNQLGVIAAGLGITGVAVGEFVRRVYNYMAPGTAEEPADLGTGPAAKAIRLRGEYPDPEGPPPRVEQDHVIDIGDEEETKEMDTDDVNDPFVEWDMSPARNGQGTKRVSDVSPEDASKIAKAPRGRLGSVRNPTRNAQPIDWSTAWDKTTSAPRNMEQTNDQPMEAANRRAFGPSVQFPSGARSNYTTPVYKIPEVNPYHHTVQAIIPYHCSYSINSLTRASTSDNAVKIRMNTPIKPFENSPCLLVNQTAWTVPTRGLSPQQVGRYVVCTGSDGSICEKNFHRVLLDFDDAMTTFLSPNLTSQTPAAWNYYANHYKCYTVVKCEWMIRISMPWKVALSSYNAGNGPTSTEMAALMNINTPGYHKGMEPGPARAFLGYHVSGDSFDQNYPIASTTADMERWFNVFENKETIVPNGVKVIRGTWYPGKVKHATLNDNDMETWTAVGLVPTTGHLEHLVIDIKEAMNANNLSTVNLCVNCNVELKYHVQFKDPLDAIQYPKTGQSNPANTVINDVVLQLRPGLPA